jgi:hypothetical protein
VIHVTGESAVDRLLDSEYHANCEADFSPDVPLADVRAGLASIPVDMTADFAAERDERQDFAAMWRPEDCESSG